MPRWAALEAVPECDEQSDRAPVPRPSWRGTSGGRLCPVHDSPESSVPVYRRCQWTRIGNDDQWKHDSLMEGGCLKVGITATGLPGAGGVFSRCLGG